MAAFLARLWNGPLIHVVDIGLVALIIYRVLLLIQGTRAVQVLRGLVVLALATLIVENFLHLPTLGWILKTFWLGWPILNLSHGGFLSSDNR
jgi:diadenylate cyclase